VKQHLFDTQSGNLTTRHVDNIQRAVLVPPHVLPLGRLLTTEDFPFTVDSYPKPDPTEWQPKHYRSLGKVAVESMRSEGITDRALTWRHLQRLYHLGLGPDCRRYFREGGSGFVSMTDFQRYIGSPVNNPNGAFLSWTIEDYTDHAKDLMAKLDRVPTMVDYIESANDGYGPSYDVIRERVGGIGLLHDRLGFPYIPGWHRQDYIDWGVQVVDANPNESLTALLCDILSRKKRGPSASNVISKFSTWTAFKRSVEDDKLGMAAPVDLATVRATKIEKYQRMIASGELPSSYLTLEPQALIRCSAKFLIAQHFLREASLTAIHAVAAKESFVTEIIKRSPSLTAGHIEVVATSKELFDDVWPAPDSRDYLHVAMDEMAEYRKRQMDTIRRRRARNAAKTA